MNATQRADPRYAGRRPVLPQLAAQQPPCASAIQQRDHAIHTMVELQTVIECQHEYAPCGIDEA